MSTANRAVALLELRAWHVRRTVMKKRVMAGLVPRDSPVVSAADTDDREFLMD